MFFTDLIRNPDLGGGGLEITGPVIHITELIPVTDPNNSGQEFFRYGNSLPRPK